MPSGLSGFTVEVTGGDRDADLAVFLGDEELCCARGEAPNPTLTVARPRAGTYRIVVANLGTEELHYVLSAVLDGAAVLELASVVVASGAPIAVRFAGAPGEAGGWIGLFGRGADDAAFVSRQFLEGATAGQRSFEAPSEVGAYEFRMLANDGADVIAMSLPVHVEVAKAPGTGPIGHGACETDGACCAP
ncbi:MAG: hypothetical protein P1P87_10235 [Trueperaceae bacterium]|nr:hypothetical protein [Trueperaceae bacterium]